MQPFIINFIASICRDKPSMKSFATLLFLPLLLVACTTKEQGSTVISGMSKTEVIQIEGKPISCANQEQYDLFFYANQLLADQPNRKADHVFIFAENKLVEYSTINIRSTYDKNEKVRLNAKQSLACWVKQLNLPVDPSASANKNIQTNGVDCFQM